VAAISAHLLPSPLPPVSYFLTPEPRMQDMTTRTRATTKTQTPKLDDEVRFEAWLSDFDARMADLTLRQDALLRKLGIEPARPAEREHA
jgi:hypothetical protein